MALPEASTMTEAEYLAYERDSTIKHEFLDGYVYTTPEAIPHHIDDGPKHNDIAGNIFAFFHHQFRASDCTVNNSDSRVRVTALGNYFYPEIVVYENIDFSEGD